jgi:hypothetical protein
MFKIIMALMLFFTLCEIGDIKDILNKQQKTIIEINAKIAADKKEENNKTVVAKQPSPQLTNRSILTPQGCESPGASAAASKAGIQ